MTNLNIDIGVNAPVCLGMVLRGGGGQMVPSAHPRHAAICFVTRLPGWRSRPPPWWAMVGSLRESTSSYATIYAPGSSLILSCAFWEPRELPRLHCGEHVWAWITRTTNPTNVLGSGWRAAENERGLEARLKLCCDAAAGKNSSPRSLPHNYLVLSSQSQWRLTTSNSFLGHLRPEKTIAA
eukprot:COSAG06_NODE_1822_length_8283_cov_33.324255_2_plen_181_part_00